MNLKLKWVNIFFIVICWNIIVFLDVISIIWFFKVEVFVLFSMDYVILNEVVIENINILEEKKIRYVLKYILLLIMW